MLCKYGIAKLVSLPSPRFNPCCLLCRVCHSCSCCTACFRINTGSHKGNLTFVAVSLTGFSEAARNSVLLPPLCCSKFWRRGVGETQLWTFAIESPPDITSLHFYSRDLTQFPCQFRPNATEQLRVLAFLGGTNTDLMLGSWMSVELYCNANQKDTGILTAPPLHLH